MTEEQENKYERQVEEYGEHLSRMVEDDFTGINGVKSANATVNYDESQNQYSLELSLMIDENINEDQVEMYKNVLRKICDDVKLIINGELIPIYNVNCTNSTKF